MRRSGLLLWIFGAALAACAPAARAPDPLTHPRLARHPEDPSGYDWSLPRGFPVPRVPADNPMSAAKVDLGRHLFYDTLLSGNHTQSCASCHRQELAFTDGRARAQGSTGALHPRSAMSLANVAYAVSLDWADPRLTRLEQQARIPLFNTQPVELGMAGRKTELVKRLETVAYYRRAFAEAFPEPPAADTAAGSPAGPITFERVLDALASFVRTLISGGSPYDRLVFHGEGDALSEPAWRGMELFFSQRLGCSQCHGGFNLSGPVTYLGGPPAEPAFHNTGLYDLDGRGAYPAHDTGLHRVSGRRRDMGRFRAPTLRNIAVTAPYMHDGSLATLEEVVAHYARGGRRIDTGPYAGDGRDSPRKSDRITGFEITPGETADLLAFLDSLTDESFLRDPRLGDPWSPAAPR